VVPSSDVRAARAFLTNRGIRSISPRLFAAAAVELDKEFAELLAFLGRVYDGYTPQSRLRQEQIRTAAGG
jgi:hypothetical protein